MLTLSKALKSSKAAIDLASIMVGVIIIGLIGGVIAATVFAVIPWSQDKAAKQQLDSVHTAQNAFFGLSSDPSQDLVGGKKNSFASSVELGSNNLLASNPTYCTVSTTDGKDYHAYAKSGSGKWFYALNSNKQAQVLTAGIVPCVTAEVDVDGDGNSDPVVIVDPTIDDGSDTIPTAPTAPAVPAVAPVFTSISAMPAGNVGTSYSYTFSASGTPAPTFTVASLPLGLTLNAETGVVSGTPKDTFNGPVVVTATNKAGQVTITKTLVINPFNPTVIYYNNGKTISGSGKLDVRVDSGTWRALGGAGQVTNQGPTVDRSNSDALSTNSFKDANVYLRLTVKDLEPGTYQLSLLGSISENSTWYIETEGATTYSRSLISLDGWKPMSSTFTTTGDATREIIVRTYAPKSPGQFPTNILWDDVKLTKIG